jgi:hypothetical protein
MKLNFLWPREVFVATFTVRGSAVPNAEESRCDSMVGVAIRTAPDVLVTLLHFFFNSDCQSRIKRSARVRCVVEVSPNVWVTETGVAWLLL